MSIQQPAPFNEPLDPQAKDKVFFTSSIWRLFFQQLQVTINAITTAFVASFNGRTGIVVPQAGDYTVGQVTGAEPTLPLTTLGDTLYEDGVGRQRLAGNIDTVQKFLSQTGDGVNSAAPSWQLLPVNGTLTYYFQNTASDIATYLKALSMPYSPKTTLTYAGLAGTSVIQNFATDPGFPGLVFIPAGTFIFHIHAAKTGGTKATQLYAQFWEVSATGVDIAQIGTNTEFTPNLTGSEVEYEVAMVTSNTYMMGSAASRVVGRIFAAVTGGGSAPTVSAYVGGSADSHIELPANSVDATNFLPYSGATKNLDLGAHTATATQITSTIAIGTAPLVVTSTTPVANLNTTGYVSSLAGGNNTTLLGSIPYQSNTNTTALLSPNTVATKKFLSQTGTGTNGAIPAWGALVSGDIPNNAANTTGTSGGLTGTPAITVSGVTVSAASPVVQAVSSVNNNTVTYYLSDGTHTSQWIMSGGVDYWDVPTSVTIRNSASGNATLATINATGIQSSGTFVSSDGSTGISTTVTTASLVGKTITIKNGIITGFV